MQITEIRFSRSKNPDDLLRGLIGHCEITLDHSVILDEVELVDCDGELTLNLWGATLCTFIQLAECLSLGLSINWLENFRQRLAAMNMKAKVVQQSGFRAA